MGAIFAKTSKGQAEIANRSGGLSPRVRRVLIFIDGKRSINELRSMLQSDDLQHTLGLLEESGYIELVKLIGADGKTTPATSPQPSITAFRELPSEFNPVDLQQARNFMTNTLKAFVGPIGATSLLTRLEQAEGHAGLRQLYDEWYYCMVMSREGRREAESLRTRLLKLL